jgi:uncharacterized protein YcfL
LTFSRLALWTLPLVLAAGCATSAGVDTRDAPSPHAVRDARIFGDAEGLGLVVGEIRASRTKGGVLESQIDLSNDTGSHNEFMYRFDWVDADGRVIPSKTSVWKPGHITPRGRTVISAVAPVPEATDFRLDMRARESN